MLPQAEDYYATMAGRGRLIYLTREHYPWAIATFFVLHSEEELTRFHPRPQWTTPPDAKDGPVVLIDTLGGLGFSRALLRLIEAEVVQRVPSVQVGVWYRLTPRGYKRYTYTRRGVLSHGQHLPR